MILFLSTAHKVMPCFLRPRWLLCENPADCALAKTALGRGLPENQSYLGNFQAALRRAFDLPGPRKESKTEGGPEGKPKTNGVRWKVEGGPITFARLTVSGTC